MHLKRILFKNTGIQLFAQAVSTLVVLSTTFILSRFLGVERFGGLNYVFAFYYFFLALQDMGIDAVVVRECSKNPDNVSRIIGTMRTFKLICAFVLVGIAWTLIYRISFSIALKPALYLYALILPLLALQLPAVIFQVNLNAKYPALVGILKSCGNFVFLIALVALGFGMTGYVMALVLTEWMGMITISLFSSRYVQPVWALEKDLCIKILKSSFIFGIAGIFVAITNRVDFLMLERMTDLHQLGLYSAVYKVTNILESLPLAMMATLYPVMSRHSGPADLERLRTIYTKSLLLLAAIALPMGFGVTIFAKPIIWILFGSKFLGAVIGLRILIWATVCLYLALTSGYVLLSLGREKINLAVNILSAVLNITLNFFWIPKYGFVGAAAATALSYLNICICLSAAAWVVLKSRKVETKKPDESYA